jgi:hypothetical protein
VHVLCLVNGLVNGCSCSVTRWCIAARFTSYLKHHAWRQVSRLTTTYLYARRVYIDVLMSVRATKG